MSSDEVGVHGRQTIEAYIRQQIPVGHAQAFPAEQLAELNLHRTQRERFDPYGANVP